MTGRNGVAGRARLGLFLVLALLAQFTEERIYTSFHLETKQRTVHGKFCVQRILVLAGRVLLGVQLA